MSEDKKERQIYHKLREEESEWARTCEKSCLFKVRDAAIPGPLYGSPSLGTILVSSQQFQLMGPR